MAGTKMHTKYVTEDGQICPSVTTVLGLRAKPALIHWAWQLGTEGEDYRKVRDHAADIGTCAHELASAHIMNRTPDTEDFSPKTTTKAITAYEAFKQWYKTTRITLIASEVKVVSERLAVGGTIDIIGVEKGKFCVVDIKSGSGVYQEHKYQIAAYANILKEVMGLEYVPSSHIIRIDRDTGEFQYHKMPVLEFEWEAFLCLLNLWNIEMIIRKDNKRKR